MIFPLSKTIRIRGSEHCWNLERSITRKGQPEWQAFKYFQTVAEAVGEACGREIRVHPTNTLAEAIEAVDQIAARYSKYLDDALAEVKPRRAA